MSYFSVIIPLYNKEKYIANTLKSVLAQTFQDFEVIIINDGSTDNSLEVVRTFDDSRIKIFEQENQGLSATRNKGTKLASANFIAFLDADDIWKPSFLSTIKTLIENFPNAGLFATNYEELYPNGVSNIYKNRLIINNIGIIEDFFKVSIGASIYYPSSFCAKKEVFETIDGFNEKITFSEDIDFNIRANLKYRLAYSNEACINYIVSSENQITNTPLANKIIPDFDFYESLAKNNLSLKRYLDFNRYTIAKRYKIEGNIQNFKKAYKQINLSNLNYKQRILLILPIPMLKLIKILKLYLLKKNIMITTYD